MKEIIIPLLLSLILIFSCDPNQGTETPTATPGAPVVFDLSGARSLFLQASGSRALVDASLMKSTTDGITQVICTDEKGTETTAAVSQVKELSAAYLLIKYTYELTDYTAVVNTSTGVITNIPVSPENWDMIRVKEASAYYSSGADLIRLNLATGATTDLNPAEYPISSQFYIFVNDTDSVGVFYMANTQDKRFWLFSPSGEMIYDMSGQPTGEVLYDGMSPSGSKLIWAITDPSTQYIYHCQFMDTYVQVTRCWIDDTLGLYSDSQNPQQLPISNNSQYVRYGSGLVEFENSVFTDDTHIVRFSISGNMVSLTTYAQSTETQNYSDLRSSSYVQASYKKLYVRLDTGHLIQLDVSGATTAEKYLVMSIDNFKVADDLVFYEVSGTTYCYDVEKKTHEIYMAPVENIEAVK